MARTRISLVVTGIRQIVRNTEQRTLLAPTMHEAMEDIGELGLATARSKAPRGPSSNGHRGGMTAAQFGMRLQAKPLPLWVSISTTATRTWVGHGRYSYPKRVEWDPKLHHAHWLRTAFGQLKSRFDSTLKRAGTALESGWGT